MGEEQRCRGKDCDAAAVWCPGWLRRRRAAGASPREAEALREQQQEEEEAEAPFEAEVDVDPRGQLLYMSVLYVYVSLKHTEK